MATLVLLRHAKSAYPQGVDDHDRPLKRRGQRDAPVAGEAIRKLVPEIDLALVSTARRAQQTYDLAGPALSVSARRDVPELYMASPDTMLRRIRAEHVDTLLVVSHNPGTEELAGLLVRDTRGRRYGRMRTKFPTAAFAVLAADEPFSDWGYACADLVAFEVARG